MPEGFRRKRAREERRVRVDGNGLRRAAVGNAGLDDDALAHLLAELDADAEQLERQRRSGWALLPATRTDLREIRRLRDRVVADVLDVLVLADPDIALAIEALAATPMRDGTATRPRLHVVAGPDPDRFTTLVETLEWPRTLVVVVSTGDTDLLTTSHFLVVRDRLLRELGAVEYQRHVVVLTPPGDTALGQIVHDEGFRSLPAASDHATSALGVATLLALVCVGGDAAEVVAGAGAMLERRKPSAAVRPAHLLAAAVRLAGPPGLRVLPPPIRALHGLACWMERRLATPLAATEEAPTSRRVTLVLGAAPHAPALVVPKAYQDVESVGFVGGLDLGVIAAHAGAADELALWAAGELTLAVTLPDVGPHAVGQLVALTEAAACLAHPSGAEPSSVRVERLAAGLVGRPGYEADRALAERLAGQREERWVA